MLRYQSLRRITGSGLRAWSSFFDIAYLPEGGGFIPRDDSEKNGVQIYVEISGEKTSTLPGIQWNRLQCTTSCPRIFLYPTSQTISMTPRAFVVNAYDFHVLLPFRLAGKSLETRCWLYCTCQKACGIYPLSLSKTGNRLRKTVQAACCFFLRSSNTSVI